MSSSSEPATDAWTPPDVSVPAVQARVRASYARQPHLVEFPDAVGHLMREEMLLSRGMVGPTYLRPMVTQAIYGDECVPHLLTLLLREASTLRMFATPEQERDIDALEVAAIEVIKRVRSRRPAGAPGDGGL